MGNQNLRIMLFSVPRIGCSYASCYSLIGNGRILVSRMLSLHCFVLFHELRHYLTPSYLIIRRMETYSRFLCLIPRGRLNRFNLFQHSLSYQNIPVKQRPASMLDTTWDLASCLLGSNPRLLFPLSIEELGKSVKTEDGVAIGIAVYDAYNAFLLSETHLINEYRSTFLQNALPQLDFPNPSSFIVTTTPLPFIQRDLVTFYSFATSAVFLFIPLLLTSDVAAQFVRDQVNGFRLILEVAGVATHVEILALLLANIPSVFVVALVAVSTQFAVGAWRQVGFFVVFVILFIGLMANIAFTLFISIRSSGITYFVIPVIFSLFSLMGFKDDYLYATRFTAAGQFINAIFTPGTLAAVVGRITESDYLGVDMFTDSRLSVGLGILVIQFVVYTALAVVLHVLLPGKMSPSIFKRHGASQVHSEALVDVDESSSDVPVLQLRLGDNTYEGTNKGVRRMELVFKGGQSIALLGHNGAGKTTLISLLCGVQRLKEGYFKYTEPGQKPLTMDNSSNDIKTFRSKLGFCPQHNALRDELTAYDHLEFIAAVRGIKSVTKRIVGIDGEISEESVSVREYLESILEQLELTYAMNRPVKTYSGGMLRKTCLAVSLVGEPSVLILD
ncbi:hypothetical protein HK096_003382, partial [Nowakowskiella sp. JEL0078]